MTKCSRFFPSHSLLHIHNFCWCCCYRPQFPFSTIPKIVFKFLFVQRSFQLGRSNKIRLMIEWFGNFDEYIILHNAHYNFPNDTDLKIWNFAIALLLNETKPNDIGNDQIFKMNTWFCIFSWNLLASNWILTIVTNLNLLLEHHNFITRKMIHVLLPQRIFVKKIRIIKNQLIYKIGNKMKVTETYKANSEKLE